MKTKNKRQVGGAFRALAVLMVLASPPSATLLAQAANEFVPCQIHQTVKVKFPVRAFHEGVVRGEVSLMLEVDRDGRLGDVLAFAHTGREFARAALDAVEEWEFTPARFDGEPVKSVTTVNIQFEVSGVTAHTKLIAEPERETLPGERYAYRPFNLDELDRVPKALSRPSPPYPGEWIQEGRTGAVTIDYFIDENGYTRFPRVVGRADDLLGAATLETVRFWEFEPPLRQGRPVLAQIRQTFYFRPEKKEAERG